MEKCPFCGKEYAELDPSGPEQVDNPVYVPDCDCADKYEEDPDEYKNNLEDR